MAGGEGNQPTSTCYTDTWVRSPLSCSNCPWPCLLAALPGPSHPWLLRMQVSVPPVPEAAAEQVSVPGEAPRQGRDAEAYKAVGSRLADLTI